MLLLLSVIDLQAAAFASRSARRSVARVCVSSPSRRLLSVVVLPPRTSDAAAAIRQATIANRNASCRPELNGPEIRCGKNERPVSAAWLCAGSDAEHVRADEVFDRVVAEERGEQDRHRRHVATRCARVAAETPWACSPEASACGRLAARPRIISVKKIPTESTCAEFWKVWFMPPPAPRSCGRQAVHHRGAVGRGEQPHRDAHQQQHRREHAEGEVDRQQARAARS